MTNLQIALILLGISIFLIISSYKISRIKTKRMRKHVMTAIGIFLMAFGIYELPWGVMEVYKITEDIFNFNLIENYTFWTIICIICIIVGYILYRGGRKK